ncbi:MAG TPA: hypothetical protein VIL86_06550 [Tepidisphaeraceae bacterium]|jgi:hypothetical protein
MQRIIAVILFLALLGGIFAVLYHQQAQQKASKPQPQAPLKSPDGKYVLVTSIASAEVKNKPADCVKFEIRDGAGAGAGRPLFEQQTVARVRFPWRMGWDVKNRVWLTSNDIGVKYWEPDGAGGWRPVTDIAALATPAPASAPTSARAPAPAPAQP